MSKYFEREGLKGRCYGCFLSRKACLCDEVIKFDTQTKVVILMHPKEYKYERTGTGKLTSLFFKDAKVISGINFDEDSYVQKLLKDPSYYPCLLYPGKTSLNLSNEGSGEILKKQIPQGKRLLIFLIDGTWACAKKMMRLSTCLQDIPRVGFTPEFRSQFHIKSQPHEHCLSTIESTYCLMKDLRKMGLESDHKFEKMLETFDQLNQFFMECAQDPRIPSYRKTSGYKTPQEKLRKTKRWTKYQVFYQ